MLLSSLVPYVLILGVALTSTACISHNGSENLFTTMTQNSESVPKHGLFELTFKHNGDYRNKFFDVSLEVDFKSPSGETRSIKGFYYNDDLWKIRFRPDESGSWTYVYTVATNGNFSKKGDGAFQCRPSDAEGPVLRHPDNPYRWIFANGKPYFAVGLQDCIASKGAQLGSMLIDGDISRNNAREVSAHEYFSLYGQAGFNLFRFSQKNCSYSLYEDLDNYRVNESILTDKLLSAARKNGFRIMFGFFGYHGKHSNSPESNRVIRVFRRVIQRVLGTHEEAIQTPREEAVENPEDAETIAKEKRFIDYCVARWGVYVDFWELLNERKASDEWTTLMANYVHTIDPDNKPVSTSWEKPYLDAVDINSPHWYESENELTSDLLIHQQAVSWKQAGKPVIVGEHGNTGMNWDPLSALRMRIRCWTSLFQEIGLIFWNTSWSKAGMHYGRTAPGKVANIYIGPEERSYIRVLQDFSSQLDADVRIVPVEVSSPDAVRAYGLLSRRLTAAYLHHFSNHTHEVHDLRITISLPQTATSGSRINGKWIDPSTGHILKHFQVTPGLKALKVPPFTVDLALLVTTQHM